MVAAKELEIIGSHGCAAKDMPEILKLVSDKLLHPNQLIEKEVTLEEGANILMAMDDQSPLGIVMITKFDDVPASRY